MQDPNSGVSIKDRRYHLHLYPKSFVGKEAVDWLMAKASLKFRVEAVTIGQQLQKMGVIHPVRDGHEFADEMYLYSFSEA